MVEVGFHKRLAVWLLGWTKGFWVPMIVLCFSMSIVGSFMSAPAMCSFMVPVMMAVYYGSVKATSPRERWFTTRRWPNICFFPFASP